MIEGHCRIRIGSKIARGMPFITRMSATPASANLGGSKGVHVGGSVEVVREEEDIGISG